jgi:hypothetical protein
MTKRAETIKPGDSFPPILDVLANDPAVVAAREELEVAEAAAFVARNRLTIARERVAAASAEIERVNRDGDVKADVAALYAALDAAQAAERLAEAQGTPVHAFRDAQLRVVEEATAAAVARYFFDLRERARVEEDAMVAAIDALTHGSAAVEALERGYTDARNLVSKAERDRHNVPPDLYSLPRRERDMVRPFRDAFFRALGNAQRGRGEPMNPKML